MPDVMGKPTFQKTFLISKQQTIKMFSGKTESSIYVHFAA